MDKNSVFGSFASAPSTTDTSAFNQGIGQSSSPSPFAGTFSAGPGPLFGAQTQNAFGSTSAPGPATAMFSGTQSSGFESGHSSGKSSDPPTLNVFNAQPLFGTTAVAATGPFGGNASQIPPQSKTSNLFGSVPTAQPTVPTMSSPFGQIPASGGFGSFKTTSEQQGFGKAGSQLPPTEFVDLTSDESQNEQTIKPSDAQHLFKVPISSSFQPKALFGSSKSGSKASLNQEETATVGQQLFGNLTSDQGKGGLFGEAQSGTGTFGSQSSSFSASVTSDNPERTSGLFVSKGNKDQREVAVFGSKSTGDQGGSGLFGRQSKPNQEGSVVFGSQIKTNQEGSGLFGRQTKPNQQGSGLFGSQTKTNQEGSGMFGSQTKPNQERSGLFGSQAKTNQEGSGLFGSQTKTNQEGSGMFGSQTKGGSGLFGSQTNPDDGRSVVFGSKGHSDQGSSGLFGSQKKPDEGRSVVFGTPTKDDQGGSGLFGKSQTEDLQKTSVNRGAMFAPSQPKSSVGLFGKPMGGSEQFEQSQEPQRKSLSKWARSRDAGSQDFSERKRREADDQDTDQNQVEAKRSRGTSFSGEARSPHLAKLRMSRKSAEDVTRTSLVVKDIPANLNKGSLLRRHFSHFGTITRLQPTPSKGSATITFQTHEEASAAKTNGKQLAPGQAVQIFWRAAGPLKSPDVYKRQTELTHTARSSMVQDELSSMAGTQDLEYEIGPVSPPKPTMSLRTHTRTRSPTPPPAQPPALPPSATSLEQAKALLKQLWTSRAQDATSKIAVLDARDKLLRLLIGRKQSDLAVSAQAFIGSCLEMCPEKERHYREDCRLLALYEVIPETLSSLTGLKSMVDHGRAVKEYSRSSADQEEPLPHELRPLQGLMTTMTYLLTEIADQGGDGQWSEWFDFLWNRTRAIRKDITQQQLCHVEVAGLLEKCCRFHVVCSARLCEEDSMSFDSKINDENLTKCLQTLKELYYDLEHKQGEFCPHEAEFRGYMVMMRLNEGDILREIQQMRPSIRASPPILFAVKAYNALNSRNYVRFFRLIQRANALTACMLHRYFNQIRSQALRIIMKAHGALGKNKIMYPATEMMRTLGFESPQEVEEFCYHFCLQVEGGDVVLDAKAFLEPETSLPQRRSRTLVEGKRTVSIGETINGGPLPPLRLAPPTSSFDHNGKFIISPELQNALYANGLTSQPSPADLISAPSQTFKAPTLQSGMEASGDQLRLRGSGPLTSQPMTSHLPDAAAMARDRQMFSNEAIKSNGRAVILEVIDAALLELAQEVMDEEWEAGAVLGTLVGGLVEEVTGGMIRPMCESVITQEEGHIRETMARTLAEQRTRVIGQLADDITEDAVNDEVQEAALEECRHIKAQLKRECVQRVSDSCSGDLLTSVMSQLVQEVSQEVWDVDVCAKRERLAEAEKAVVITRMSGVFQVWRAAHKSRLRVKRAMLDFPCAPPTQSTGQRLASLVPHRPEQGIHGRAFYIGDRARLRVSTPMEVIQQDLMLATSLSMASVNQMLTSLRLWQALDVPQALGLSFRQAVDGWRDAGVVEGQVDCIKWKLCLSLPKQQPKGSPESQRFGDWLRAKLCKDADRDNMLEKTPDYQGEVLSLYHCPLPQSGSPVLRLCVRGFHGGWNDTQEVKVTKASLLKGTSTVLFVTSPVEELEGDQSLWNKESQRLHQILRVTPPCPALPLVIVVPRKDGGASGEAREIVERFELEKLRDSGLISAVHLAQPHIGQGCQSQDWEKQLTSCLRFSARHMPPPPAVVVKPVTDFVEDAVVEWYKAPVYQDLRERRRRQLLHQSPNVLISLYNGVTEHVGGVAASASLAAFSWPPPEMDASADHTDIPSSWNSEDSLASLYELVAKLRLPAFRYRDLEAQDWDSLCADVWAWLAVLTKKDSGAAKISLHHQVRDLLASTRAAFDTVCWLAQADGPCEPTYLNMAWTDLIDAAIHYRLLALRTGHLRVEAQRDDDDDSPEPEYVEPLVLYLEEEMEDWEAPQGWEEAVHGTHMAEEGQLKPSVVEATMMRETTMIQEKTKIATEMKTTTDMSVQQKSLHARDSSLDTTPPSSLEDLKQRFAREREAEARFEEMLSGNLIAELPDQENVNPFTCALSRSHSQLHRTRELSDLSTSSKNNISSFKIDSIHPLKPHGHESEVEMEADRYKPTSLTEGLTDLQGMLHDQRTADRLFELKLQRLMNPTLLDL